MKLIIRNTFTKVAVLTYFLGTCAHIAVLVTEQPGEQMPNIVHWIVTLLAGYAGLGFLMNIKRIPFRNLADKIVYWFVLIHLVSSALVHGYSIIWNTNDWLTVFSYSYSYFAVLYFFTFGFYSFILDKRIRNG